MVDNSNTSVSYSTYRPSGQLGSKLEHVIITFQKNEIPLFGRAVEVVGWQSIFIVILCTLKQTYYFLFNKENAVQVIDEFGQLILDTFTDEELQVYKREGVHVIGMVHEKKEETKENHFPKGVYDYWNMYEAGKAKKRENFQKLIDYFRRGIEIFQNTGEKSEQIEWICKGLRRLVNTAKECNYIPSTGNTLNSLMKMLSDEQKKDFRKLLMSLSDFCNSISKDDWKAMIKIMKGVLTLYDEVPNEKVNEFVKWTDQKKEMIEKGDEIKTLPNHYIYIDEKTGRMVDMEFGSIHSVKGRTHLATLVLETYMKSHNMKSILKYLCGKPPKTSKHPEKKLKCQYVAMTRARALICLAIPIDFVDAKIQEKLVEVGWNLKVV